MMIRHHEMYHKCQEDFRADILALVDAFEKLGNPWLETSGLLYELNESIVMPNEVVKSICHLQTIGKNKFKQYLNLHINSQAECFTDTDSRKDLPLFRHT